MAVFRFIESGSTYLINLDNVREIEKCLTTIYFRYGDNLSRQLHLSSSEKCNEIFELICDRMYQGQQQIDR